MNNNKSKSERDKMLEDILSSVGKDSGKAARAAASSANRAASGKRTFFSDSQKVEKDSGKAARAAASSANRSASEKRTASSDRTTAYQRTSYETASTKNEKTASVYSRTSGGKINPEATRHESTSTFKKETTSSFAGGKTDRVYDTEKTTVIRPQENTDKFSSTEKISGNTSKMRNTDSYNTESYSEKKDYENTSSYRSVKTSNPESEHEHNHKPKSKKRSGPSGRLPMVLILTTIIFTVAISLSIIIISVGRDMLAIGKSEDIKIINIPAGSNTEDVAQILYDEGIIKIPKAFVFISKMGDADTKYIAGEHQVSPSYAYETLINELTTDRSLEKETVDVTFLEGCDLISAGKKLEEAGVCEAERFVYYFNSGDYGFEFEKYLPVST